MFYHVYLACYHAPSALTQKRDQTLEGLEVSTTSATTMRAPAASYRREEMRESKIKEATWGFKGWSQKVDGAFLVDEDFVTCRRRLETPESSTERDFLPW